MPATRTVTHTPVLISFLNRKSRIAGNTAAIGDGKTAALFLYGHRIAEIADATLTVLVPNQWVTQNTLRRLNALLGEANLPYALSRKDGRVIMNGIPLNNTGKHFAARFDLINRRFEI